MHRCVPKPCLHGWGRVFLTVAPDGAVLPCQTAREIPGLEFPNVRNSTLSEIWFHSRKFLSGPVENVLIPYAFST